MAHMIIDQWICILLRGGGFRPCRIVKTRSSIGAEIYERIVEQKEAFMSAAVAEGEALEWAEDLKIRYRAWP